MKIYPISSTLYMMLGIHYSQKIYLQACASLSVIKYISNIFYELSVCEHEVYKNIKELLTSHEKVFNIFSTSTLTRE